MDAETQKAEPGPPESQAEFKVPGLVGPLTPKKIVKSKQLESSSKDPDGSTDVQPAGADDSSSRGDESGVHPAVDSNGSKQSEGKIPSCEVIPEEKKKPQQGSQKRIELKLNYQEPPGAMSFDTRYSLEVLKAGSIVGQVKFSKDKTFFVIGRTPACDIVAENPTVSRMHAIIQFIGGTSSQEEKSDVADQNSECKERGLYLYDLNSTHGTFLNKNQVFPSRYYRLRVGHIIKFGNSTRQYIVDGPSEDQEEESDKSVTELLQERLEKEFIRKKIKEAAETKEEEKIEDTGIDWGMGEDAVEESDLSVNPFSLDFESSDLNLDNPKKTLAGWFEREGYDDLFYDVREKASGHFICRVNLPLDGPTGAPVLAEVDLKGKKKDVIVQCALKACQILDKYGVLRQSHREGYKKKLKDWEEKDYYSSDEDTFLDRTGSIETKRKRRMKESGKDTEKAESFEALNDKYNSIEEEIQKLEQQIQKAVMKQEREDDEVDPLEAFMQTVKSGALDMKQMKSKVKQLKEEQAHVKKLIEIARPANLPSSLLTKKSTGALSIKKEENTKDESASGAKSGSTKETKRENVEAKDPEEQKKSAEAECPKPKHETPAPVKIEIGVNPVLKRTAAPITRPFVFNDNDDTPDPDEETPGEDDLSVSSKKKRKRNRAQFKKEDKLQYDADNPDYSVWVPPTDQAGDGKTKLNEKLGY